MEKGNARAKKLQHFDGTAKWTGLQVNGKQKEKKSIEFLNSIRGRLGGKTRKRVLRRGGKSRDFGWEQKSVKVKKERT